MIHLGSQGSPIFKTSVLKLKVKFILRYAKFGLEQITCKNVVY